jgi:hypothetical protein
MLKSKRYDEYKRLELGGRGVKRLGEKKSQRRDKPRWEKGRGSQREHISGRLESLDLVTEASGILHNPLRGFRVGNKSERERGKGWKRRGIPHFREPH